MAKEEMQVGQLTRPRFEFRTFGQQFDAQAKRMARLSVPIPEKLWERRSSEIYIMSRATDAHNTKIRDGKMDIKAYVQSVEGLEQWNPLMKAEFPIAAATLRGEVLEPLRVASAALDRDPYTLEAFLALVAVEPELQAVRVDKHRFGYSVNETICEVAEVLINGARVMTLNCESTEIEDILKAIADIGLVGVENINYLQAIKRVVGMIDKPLAS